MKFEITSIASVFFIGFMGVADASLPNSLNVGGGSVIYFPDLSQTCEAEREVEAREEASSVPTTDRSKLAQDERCVRVQRCYPKAKAHCTKEEKEYLKGDQHVIYCCKDTVVDLVAECGLKQSPGKPCPQ